MTAEEVNQIGQVIQLAIIVIRTGWGVGWWWYTRR